MPETTPARSAAAQHAPDPLDPASPALWEALSERLRTADEDRWLSSRYASAPQRKTLTALYAFVLELARVRLVTTEPMLAAIRFQWWHDVLEEIAAGGPVRRHDTALAVADRVRAAALDAGALSELADGYEAATVGGDRAAEPEALLMGTAANVLGPDHDWHGPIAELAPRFAALRRGEAVGAGPAVSKAPAAIRPAVAHLRLRKVYAKSGSDAPGGAAKRLSVLRAVMTGRV